MLEKSSDQRRCGCLSARSILLQAAHPLLVIAFAVTTAATHAQDGRNVDFSVDGVVHRLDWHCAEWVAVPVEPGGIHEVLGGGAKEALCGTSRLLQAK